MKYLFGFGCFAVLLASITLSGCSGFEGTSYPAVTSQSPLGPIQGNVFGGHAPIVGAHVFVLEATTGGYGAKAKSLLTPPSTASTVGYPLAEDTTTGSVTNGLYYVESDINGGYNITGDYTCDSGSPVYLYASGGAPTGNSAISITGISETLSGTTYTYTFTGSNSLATGGTVAFPGFSLSGEWATLNGTTQTVLATPSATSFQIATTIAPGTGSNVQTGGAIGVGPINAAIVNLAMLGVCSSSGNFSSGTNALSFIYMNEVSTVATAYGMAGFATDSFHIGSSSTNATGLQNAAYNAGNLYDIQGGNVGSGGNGEGHIARSVTVAGNGTVPQTELDTLANILAACVDSVTTSACSTLFTDATTTGTSAGTKPIDTATAAINIAHNPGTANVVGLYTLPPKTSPFQPALALTSPPADFTVTINYNNITSPDGIAIDSTGDAYVTTNASASYVTKLSPTGVVLATSAKAGNGFDSVAVDTFGNVWAVANNSGQAGALYEYTGTLGAVTGSPFGTTVLQSPSFVAIDNLGFVYVTDGGNSTSIVQRFTNTGTVNVPLNNNCLTRVTAIALDPSYYIWGSIYSSNAICRISPLANTSFSTGGQPSAPTNVAIDSGGNGWVAAGGQTNLFKYTSGGSSSSYGVINNANQGGLSSPTWVAIDGGNNVWITNNGNSYALSEFNSAGVALTGTSGYGTGSLNKPGFVAIDGSGDVWVTNQGLSTVSELIGAGVPTVQPLAALKPGVEP